MKDYYKEVVGVLKLYLSIISAIIISIGAGISKLYLSRETGLLFWIGVGIEFILIFLLIANKINRELLKPKEIDE